MPDSANLTGSLMNGRMHDLRTPKITAVLFLVLAGVSLLFPPWIPPRGWRADQREFVFIFSQSDSVYRIDWATLAVELIFVLLAAGVFAFASRRRHGA
jgi:hypothetical protein